MRTFRVGRNCAALLLAAAAGTAAAEDYVNTPAFGISSKEGGSWFYNFSLLSHSPFETRLALTEMDRSWLERSYMGQFELLQSFYYGFNVSVSPNYRITGFEFGATASAQGTVDPNGYGRAEIVRFTTGLSAWQFTSSTSYWSENTSDAVYDVAAPASVSTRLDGLMIGGKFELSAIANWEGYFSSGWYQPYPDAEYYQELPSYLDRTQSGSYLTIYTVPIAAIPEPETLWLLLGGLAVMVIRMGREKAWPARAHHSWPQTTSSAFV